METLVKDEVKSPAENSRPAPGPDRRDEIEELLRIKKSHRIDGSHVPCPSCAVPVEISINHCPFCDSDIAAETALARETTRRLRELSGEIDTEHAVRTREKPKKRGFLARLKCLFEGDPEPEPDILDVDPHAKRLLNLMSPGDSIKVLEEDGSWLKVKTQAGDIGWVYSTVRKRQ